jgi:hypothetical protein
LAFGVEPCFVSGCYVAVGPLFDDEIDLIDLDLGQLATGLYAREIEDSRAEKNPVSASIGLHEHKDCEPTSDLSAQAVVQKVSEGRLVCIGVDEAREVLDCVAALRVHAAEKEALYFSGLPGSKAGGV